MELYILRHGEAGKSFTVPKRDAERPLTVRGRTEIEEIASVLCHLKYRFDLIIASPLKRTHETAVLVSRAMKNVPVEDWDELRPEGGRTELYVRMSKLGHSARLLVVGHEPYLSSMMSDIISHTDECRISLRKGGLARLSVTSFVPETEGRLRWLLTPRQIKRMG